MKIVNKLVLAVTLFTALSAPLSQAAASQVSPGLLDPYFCENQGCYESSRDLSA